MSLIAVLAAIAVACSSGSARQAPTPTAAAPSTTAAPAPTATATADPLGPPVADGQRALAHVRELAVTIGPRVAGTETEIEARDTIRSTLAGYGYDVTVQDFPFDASAFLPARVDAGGQAMQGFALSGSGGGKATGPLVVAGIGRPEDFPPGGARGAVALIKRGELTFSDKVANAIAAGAAGVVIYNSEAGNLQGDLSQAVTIPVVGISGTAGDNLASRATAGVLTATVTVSPPQGTAYNVIAKPKGVTQCATITGGHYDSVPATGGADDNAAGTAAVLETARVAAAMRLAGANCFVLFGAEEFGLLGSKAYGASLGAADVSALKAMLNLDVVGLPEGLVLLGTPSVVETARLAAQKLGLNATTGQMPDGAGSDYLSFQDAGVPAVMFYRDDNSIHTPTDAIDRISAQSLQEDVRVAIATLQALNP